MSGPLYDDPTATLVREGARPLGAIIRVLDAPATPPVLHLAEGECVVGAAPDCDLVIADRTVSRQHARIALVPEGARVSDLGSHNGTFFQGQRVEAIVLPSGGRVQLGGATVTVEVDRGDLEDELPPYPEESYRGMVSSSLAMRRLCAKLVRLEGSLVHVLIEGESGVGKELVAAALHQGSAVAEGPFVIVNCGAIARELIASELFGHVRGAFTGAHEPRQGAFDRANGGTLFLDEIGELPLELQPALLRVLESGELQPLGSDQPRRVRVRLVAATNRVLADEVAAGRFRQDLYFRLAVVTLVVAPLRERLEDVEPLAQGFAHAAGIEPLGDRALARLRQRSWPGNVRELRNVVHAYAALGVLSEPQLSAPVANLEAFMQQSIDVRRPYAEQKDEIVERFTHAYLQLLLAHTGGNQTTAAALAGLSRTYLGQLLAKHALTRKPRSNE